MMLMEVKKLSRSEKSVVTLVVDRDTGSRYVRKELRGAHPVYQQMQGLPHSFLPKIIQVEPGQDGVTLLEEYIDRGQPGGDQAAGKTGRCPHGGAV